MSEAHSPIRGRSPGAGWKRLTHGIHVSTESSLVGDLAGWQLLLPSHACFTHLTGAAVRGWWLPPIPAELPVFVSLGQSDPRPIRAGIRSMRLADPAPFEVIDGVRVATPIDILLACARDLCLVDLVVLVDGAAFTGDIELEELAAALDTLSRRRGLVRLREGWTRHGYTDDDVLHRAVSILSDADRARGREHLPERVRAWHELIRQSLFTPAGRARPARLLGLT